MIGVNASTVAKYCRLDCLRVLSPGVEGIRILCDKATLERGGPEELSKATRCSRAQYAVGVYVAHWT